MMKRMIFGIATRIDLLEFIMRGDLPSLSENSSATEDYV